MDNNIRVLPKVCPRCMDLILPPFSNKCEYEFRKDKFNPICDKCIEKEAQVAATKIINNERGANND